jgi:hypothetical protein
MASTTFAEPLKHNHQAVHSKARVWREYPREQPGERTVEAYRSGALMEQAPRQLRHSFRHYGTFSVLAKSKLRGRVLFHDANQ